MRQRWIQHPVTLKLVPAEEYMPPYENRSALVMPDIPPYQSMVTGEMIMSRSQHREHLRQHRVIEVGNETKYLKAKPLEPSPESARRRKEMLIHHVNRL